MELLAALGLSYLFRRLRRRARDPQGATPPQSVPDPVSSSAVPPKQEMRAHTALLGHAARGLLLAAMLILLALIPWPTAWAMSAVIAPAVQPWRRWVVDNVDVLTIGLVIFALIEPLLSRLLGAIRHFPHLIGLFAQLVWVVGRVAYWRYRNWQRRPMLAISRSR